MTVQELLLEKINHMEKELKQMKELIEEIQENGSNFKRNKSIWDKSVEGIPEKLDGRKLIIECLIYMSTHGEVDARKIQLAIAEKNGKKLDAINMNLRYAINYAWKNQTPAVAPFEQKPSVTKFLSYWYKNC